MPVINLNIKITVANLALATDNFLQIYPIPKDDDGKDLYSKRAWFNKVIGNNIARDLERGRVHKARKAIPFKPDYDGVDVR